MSSVCTRSLPTLYARRCVTNILLGLSFAAAPVHAEDLNQVHAWLERMSRAAHELNYTGTFVYVHNKQISTMRITHSVDAHGERQRVMALNGVGRQVINDNNSLTMMTADQSATLAKTRPRNTFPDIMRAGIDELDKYYHFSLAGEERIADRLTQRILIQPKDNYRYGYRFWLDKSSALLLKADMVQETDTLVEQLMFTEIDLNSPSRTSPAKPRSDKSEKIITQSTSADSISGWQVSGPEGFRIVDRINYPVPMNIMPVDHWVLSDGLASVSVFVEKSDSANEKFTGSSRRGAVNAFGIINGDYQITVLGEVPQATTQLIGESVRRVEEHD
jgi:sigma-E factor negative regulatory protein RseB